MSSGMGAAGYLAAKNGLLSSPPTRGRTKNAAALLLSIIFLLCVGFSLFRIVHRQMTPSQAASSSTAAIFDFAGILGKGDRESLNQKMQQLQEKFAITPLLITVSVNDTDKIASSGLYDLIHSSRKICDGWNCTLVFSEPESWESFSDWTWDVIYGENAGTTVSRRSEDLFLNTIRSCLSGCHFTVGKAIEEGISIVMQQQPQRINEKRAALIWQTVLFLMCPVVLFTARTDDMSNGKSQQSNKGFMEDWAGLL